MLDSRRNQHRGDDWWLERSGKVLPFEVQAQCFFKIRECLIDSHTLTDDIDVKAPCDIPGRFVGYSDSELHEQNRTSGL